MTRRAAITACALLAACSAPSERVVEAPVHLSPVDPERVRLEDAAGWAHRRALDVNLDDDAGLERVVLTADVVLDARGIPLWEDGHRWAVVVEDGDERTLLYGAFVPNGHVEAAMLPAGAAAGGRQVLIRERTPQQSRTFVVSYDDAGSAQTIAADAVPLEQWLPSLVQQP